MRAAIAAVSRLVRRRVAPADFRRHSSPASSQPCALGLVVPIAGTSSRRGVRAAESRVLLYTVMLSSWHDVDENCVTICQVARVGCTCTMVLFCADLGLRYTVQTARSCVWSGFNIKQRPRRRCASFAARCARVQLGKDGFATCSNTKQRCALDEVTLDLTYQRMRAAVQAANTHVSTGRR